MKKYVLVGIYAFMAVICVLLNYGDRNITNILINGVMFVVVGGIFAWTIWGCFRKTDKIKKDLEKSISQIETDHKEGTYLWTSYNQSEKSLFEQEDLKKAYKSYKSEMRYLESQKLDGSKCDIEDYINRELIDDVGRKNLLNLVPGAMTGMGILGTFVGLTIGLQNFNTGTAEEIAESIAPLMDGIKVAFHTSIYGMCFSLFFNLVYKNNFEETYRMIDQFIDTYHEKVAPDADSDNISKIIAGQEKQTQNIVAPIVLNFQRLNDNMEKICSVQQQQLQQMQQMPQMMENAIGKELSELVLPKMETLNNSFEIFAKMVGDTQLKGMEGLIDKFTTQTNAVMIDSFQNLKEVISQTCDLQTENNGHMQTVLSKVQNMTMSIQQINELSQKTIEDMSDYVEKVENLQGMIIENCKNFSEQIEKNVVFEERMKTYMDTLETYQEHCEQSMEQWSVELKRQMEIFEEIEKKIMKDLEQEMNLLMKNSRECNSQISEAANQQIKNIHGAFEDLDEKMSEISKNMMLCMKNMVQELEGTSHEINEQLQDEIMKSLTAFNEDFTRNIVTMTEKMNTTTEQLGITASDLGTTAKGFHGQLKKNLLDTFEVFDKELADICSHLSGTISDIESTTGRVPRVVAEAYKGMENGISEMEEQMLDLIKQISELNETTRKQILREKERESLNLEQKEE